MNIKIFSLVIFLCWSSVAFARLGESVVENQARYGNPVKDHRNTTSPLLKSAENKTYHYQGWQIRIGYINGQAVRMFYGKLPKKGGSQVLKPDEFQAILKAESHGGTWKDLGRSSLLGIALRPKKSGNRLFDHARLRWVNSNNCIAYSTNRMGLYVESPEAVIWEQALANEKDVKRKESIPQF